MLNIIKRVLELDQLMNDEQLTPKDYVLENTKPLFTELKLLTMHNLHKLFLMNEIFKIKKI